MSIKCKREGCKGYLTVQYRHYDLKPFIACTNYTNKSNPCSYTDNFSIKEIQLIKSEKLYPQEVLEKHYSEL